MTTDWVDEVSRGKRFKFGQNWLSFLDTLDEKRIETAEAHLKTMLQLDRLDGRAFLDVGAGSGLSSLAARRLGARVHSFDFDPDSVECTIRLRERFFPGDEDWTVEKGDALDAAYLGRLPTFDVVYSWGVLHHTGDMWTAIANVAERVRPNGLFNISIYNDQGQASERWRRIKKRYNELPQALRYPFAAAVLLPREARAAFGALRTGRVGEYVAHWTRYSSKRGMSPIHDMVDWIGGYPFEVARPEQIFDFLAARGFTLKKMRTVGGGIGCNEFVFQRV